MVVFLVYFLHSSLLKYRNATDVNHICISVLMNIYWVFLQVCNLKFIIIWITQLNDLLK